MVLSHFSYAVSPTSVHNSGLIINSFSAYLIISVFLRAKLSGLIDNAYSYLNLYFPGVSVNAEGTRGDNVKGTHPELIK
jgi:hypothetical protein